MRTKRSVGRPFSRTDGRTDERDGQSSLPSPPVFPLPKRDIGQDGMYRKREKEKGRRQRKEREREGGKEGRRCQVGTYVRMENGPPDPMDRRGESKDPGSEAKARRGEANQGDG